MKKNAIQNIYCELINESTLLKAFITLKNMQNITQTIISARAHLPLDVPYVALDLLLAKSRANTPPLMF